MICISALVVNVALENGRTGLILTATRLWAATACARWWAEMGGLADSAISSALAPATRATVFTRASRWCGARAWRDDGGEGGECRASSVECRGRGGMSQSALESFDAYQKARQLFDLVVVDMEALRTNRCVTG